MLDGIPSLFDHAAKMVMAGRHRGSLAIVIYHMLGDILNAGENALTHYFPLTLRESYLQNSSIGSPYEK